MVKKKLKRARLIHHRGRDSDFKLFFEVQNLDDMYEYQSKYMAPLYGFSPFSYDLVSTIIPEVAASKNLHVLVEGETGTGKEVVVKMIAKQAGFGDKLVCVNCAAIPKGTIESELFGYVKGAFTGARENKKGYLDEAEGGALFLDEIGELEHPTQAKLLRVIEEGEFYPVGATKPKKVKVRLFAATNKPEELRSDLLWRFQERIYLPPLRERKEDIFAILYGFLKSRFPNKKEIEWQFSPTTFLYLLFSPWPGNIRELRNAAERSFARYEYWFDAGEYICAPFYYVPPFEHALSRAVIESTYQVWQKIAKRVRREKGGRKIVPHNYEKISPLGYYSMLESAVRSRALMTNCDITLSQAVNLLVFSRQKLAEKTRLEITGAKRPFHGAISDAVQDFHLIWGLEPNILTEYFETIKDKEEIDLTQMSFEELERNYFRQLRGRCPSLKEAQEVSGMPRSTLSDKLKKLGIPRYR